MARLPVGKDSCPEWRWGFCWLKLMTLLGRLLLLFSENAAIEVCILCSFAIWGNWIDFALSSCFVQDFFFSFLAYLVEWWTGFCSIFGLLLLQVLVFVNFFGLFGWIVNWVLLNFCLWIAFATSFGFCKVLLAYLGERPTGFCSIFIFGIVSSWIGKW